MKTHNYTFFNGKHNKIGPGSRVLVNLKKTESFSSKTLKLTRTREPGPISAKTNYNLYYGVHTGGFSRHLHLARTREPEHKMLAFPFKNVPCRYKGWVLVGSRARGNPVVDMQDLGISS